MTTIVCEPFKGESGFVEIALKSDGRTTIIVHPCKGAPWWVHPHYAPSYTKDRIKCTSRAKAIDAALATF